jgi:hypothetical protein
MSDQMLLNPEAAILFPGLGDLTGVEAGRVEFAILPALNVCRPSLSQCHLIGHLVPRAGEHEQRVKVSACGGVDGRQSNGTESEQWYRPIPASLWAHEPIISLGTLRYPAEAGLLIPSAK